MKILDSGERTMFESGAVRDMHEDHLRAAAWNIMWALNQRTTHKEYIDIPYRTGDEWK